MSEQQAIATQEPAALMAVFESELIKLQPHLHQLGIDEERFTRIIINELKRTPSLQSCERRSVYAGVFRAAELGLDFVLSQCWLIPRKDQAVFQMGYKGYVELAARAGITIQTGVVYEDDEFTEFGGTDARIEHKPVLDHKGEPIACYAVARLPDGRTIHRVVNKEEAEKRRKAGRTKFEAGRPWFDWYVSMWRKTAILALKAELPMSAEMHRAFDADDQVQKVGLTGIEPMRETPPALMSAAGEPVDPETGEIIEAPASGEGERSEAPQALVVDVTPEPEEPQATGSGVGSGTDARPAPPTSESAPSEADAAHVAPAEKTAPTRPTADQIAMLKRIAAEYSWDEHQTFISFSIEGWDDPALTFDHAGAQLHLWASNIESWRRNRRARLASSAQAAGIDLPKWLADRKLPLAGEIDARSAQVAINEIEAIERSPASQPSTEESVSAPAADSTVVQDPQIRAQFDAMLSVSFAGPSARSRWRDNFLLACGVESNDDLTNDQMLAGVAKAKKETA